MLVILSAMAELEQNLGSGAVLGGSLGRARLGGRHISRPRLIVSREAALRDRRRG